MSEFQPRELHLHTLESLCADLVSGRAVSVGDGGKLFRLTDDRARSALQWYRARGADNWTANVTSPLGEQLVDAILKPPPDVPAAPARAANANKRRLTLRKVEAHRFAGLHKFGTPSQAPKNYSLELSSPITLLEGANGSGKTSLANAIIWALTGEVLRAQREPEKAASEFECWITAADGSVERTAHRLTPVTPLPHPADFRPDKNWIPADTWVELTFEDETGALLPPIRRTQSRTSLGKLVEDAPDVSSLQIDPIALRIGTIMPGILPLVRVGSESELGKAVAQLTGLSSLADLADHVRRAKQKIEKEFVRTKVQEIASADESYERARTDLKKEITNHPRIAPPKEAPPPSADPGLEGVLGEITLHLENAKASALSSAKTVLGEEFDPNNVGLRENLERNISPALSELRQLARLPSLARLNSLRRLTAAEIADAEHKLGDVLGEAKKLQALADNPTRAARARLYAHIAMWLIDHPSDSRDDALCVICGTSLEGVADPVTGGHVEQHIRDAQLDASLLSMTITRWSEAALSDLSRSLPSALQAELSMELPEHPCDVIREAYVDQLFSTAPFTGVLSNLKQHTARAFDEAAIDAPSLPEPVSIALPESCASLAVALTKLAKAIRFAKWRQANEDFARHLYEVTIGVPPQTPNRVASRSLTDRLIELEAMVQGTEPITRALVACGRLTADLRKRRSAEKRIREYKIAATALSQLLTFGELADLQIDQLRRRLRTEAEKWRKRIYLGAFPGTAHELTDATMGRRGELELVIGANGVSAPAQHVANASALRASLVGFYLAFWEHVLQERGGLRLIVLDDPQELLDHHNREKLANALKDLLGIDAQAIITTCDPKFADHVARLPQECGVEHRSVHPATYLQPVVRTPLSEAEVHKRRKVFDSDPDAEEPARAYADACRVFLEAMLGDLFDDPAYSAWVRSTPTPTFSDYVNRIRSLSSGSPQGMFSAPAFKNLVSHPAAAPGSPTATLLNRSHHGERRLITPAQVSQCAEDLAELVRQAEALHEECRRWRRREGDSNAAPSVTLALPTLPAIIAPKLRVPICPDLAAFTKSAPLGESQEISQELSEDHLASKSLYYLRRNNFGFAAPQGAIAIVETNPLPVSDRRLVIARHGEEIYARRLLRSEKSNLVGLAAETPDPRRSPRTLFLHESDVTLHQVAGVIFDHKVSVPNGRQEAVLVEDASPLKQIEIAYRVVEESAIPLALPQQIALGGPCVDLADLDHHEDSLVALTLEDGSGLFKRVGAKLPGSLSHLRQFESIGGLGSSEILALGAEQAGVRAVVHVRLIVGVLYHG